MTRHYLGIEIGGTKLQLGVGPDDGQLRGLVREQVDPAAGADGIRRQIESAVPRLLERANLSRNDLYGVGIGFGGPVDDVTRTVLTSHQIDGWDNFPLADWIADVVGLPAVLGNDADVAGLAEATHGAGKGLSPLFYITIGSGIGGGFIIDGQIYRGAGRGAAEIGQLRIMHPTRDENPPLESLETYSSGWGMQQQVPFEERIGSDISTIREHAGAGPITAQAIASAARERDWAAVSILYRARVALAEAICHVIALLCPRRIVIGGGVSLMGDDLLFAPLRRLVDERVFKSFRGLTDIVPAALGEEVVVHGAIRLARQRLT